MALHASAFAAPIKPFSAGYVVLKDNEVIANTSISLKKINDSDWQYRSTSKPTGWFASIMGVSVTETSHLQWQGNSVRIKDYRYNRTGKAKHVHLAFDWQGMSVTNSINGDEWTMQIPEGTADKLSINLALMAKLKSRVADASFPVADGGKLKYYDFKVLGTESLATALGNIKTLKIYRNKRGRRDKQATLWMAPDLDFLLVRMEKAGKGGEPVVLKIHSLN